MRRTEASSGPELIQRPSTFVGKHMRCFQNSVKNLNVQNYKPMRNVCTLLCKSGITVSRRALQNGVCGSVCQITSCLRNVP